MVGDLSKTLANIHTSATLNRSIQRLAYSHDLRRFFRKNRMQRDLAILVRIPGIISAIALAARPPTMILAAPNTSSIKFEKCAGGRMPYCADIAIEL